MAQVVLITGCSTGIGRDLVVRLAQSGYSVAATARNVETLYDLPAGLKLPLDVTRQETIDQAVQATLNQFGRIDVLVNNAGYAQCGAVEEVSDEQMKQLYDVNVFGALRMVRAVAPHMRQQRSGRIINISSIVGKLSTPVNGPYSSTKFALEALSDALRCELAPFNIQVVVVEPGSIKTRFMDTVKANANDIFSNPVSPYQPLYRTYEQVSAGMSRQGSEPQVVSRVIQQAIEARKPKLRYLAGVDFPGRLVIQLRDFVWDLVVRQVFRIRPAAD